MEEQKELAAGQPKLANLYLETLTSVVNPNKYELIRELLDVAHEMLEDKTDPLHESVDDILRKAAGRLVETAERKATEPAVEAFGTDQQRLSVNTPGRDASSAGLRDHVPSERS
ncbi:MAG: hypothetical protein ABFD13_05075 [Candidatus Cryosericum sp.]|nr:hypothetical protein [bacterium]